MIATIIDYNYPGSWSKQRRSSSLNSRFSKVGDIDASFKQNLWWSNSSSYRNTHWGPFLRGHRGESFLDAGFIFAPEYPADFVTFDVVTSPSVDLHDIDNS